MNQAKGRLCLHNGVDCLEKVSSQQASTNSFLGIESLYCERRAYKITEPFRADEHPVSEYPSSLRKPIVMKPTGVLDFIEYDESRVSRLTLSTVALKLISLRMAASRRVLLTQTSQYVTYLYKYIVHYVSSMERE